MALNRHAAPAAPAAGPSQAAPEAEPGAGPEQLAPTAQLPQVAARPALRIEFLDGVRAAAAVYVVLHHIWLTAYPSYPDYRGPAVFGWLAYGQIAVSVFIVVSGFSLSIAPARRGWELTGGARTYLSRRAWRILPTYWAALVFSCVVFGLVTPGLTGDKITLKGVLVHTFLLQDVIGTAKPNGAFWSIAVEFQIYFLFPLFLLVRRRLGVRVLVAGAGIAVIAAYLLASAVEQFEPLLNLTPQFVILFVLGIAAAHVLRRDRTGPSWRGWPLLAAGSALLLVVLLAARDLAWVEAQYFWVDLLAGVVTAFALASLAGGQLGALGRTLGSRAFRWVGSYSYSVYCVHLPLLWLLWHFAVDPLGLSPVGDLLVLAAGLPLVLLGSFVFSLAFERPFLTNRSFSAWRARLFG